MILNRVSNAALPAIKQLVIDTAEVEHSVWTPEEIHKFARERYTSAPPATLVEYATKWLRCGHKLGMLEFLADDPGQHLD